MWKLPGWVLAGSVVAAATAHASDLDRFCAMAARQVGDCACTTEFVSRQLSADDALVIMKLWAADSTDSQRPSAVGLDQQYGPALARASEAFLWKRPDFLRACPRATLVLEDGDLLRPDDPVPTRSPAGK